jgi:ABC-2 type transport system ATP-binding protein
MTTPVIDLQGVTKVYGRRTQALRGVAMRVEPGEIFGLLGPNGAGKSTLVKILMTVIRATTCTGTFMGRPVGDKGALARVGYLPEHHRFPDYLTGRQVLEFYGALCGVPRAERRRRAGELLELVGMTAWEGTRVREYSKGMRQRCGVAQALMNNPDLVVLDEPTDGVDPVGRRDIRTVLLEQKRLGRTVLLNSHLLSELEMVCDRVAILVQGQVSSQGTIDELTRYGVRYEVEVAHPSAERPLTLAEALAPVLTLSPVDDAEPQRRTHGPETRPVLSRGTLNGTVAVEAGHDTLSISTSDATVVQPMIDALRARGLTIKAVRPTRPSLEDLFMRAVSDPASGRALAPGAAVPPRSPRAPRPTTPPHSRREAAQ